MNAADAGRQVRAVRALTVKQPFADLVVAGVMDVLSLSYPPPSTLPQWWRCGDPPSGHDCDGHREYDPPGGTLEWHDNWHADAVPDGPFPFRLGIHAAKRYDTSRDATHRAIVGYDDAGLAMMRAVESCMPERRGVLVGFVRVAHAHLARFTADGLSCGCSSAWVDPVPDLYHWTLGNPEPLDTPVPMRGRPGLWTLPEVVTADG